MTNNNQQKWLAKEPDSGCKARVFFIPYSGCGASLYSEWPQHYKDVEFIAIQLPGRENRVKETSFLTYQALCEAMRSDMECYFDIPFAFFGHCSSALIAYEITKQLNNSAMANPSQLFLSAQVAPHDGPYGTFLTATDDELRDVLKNMFSTMGGTLIPDLIEFNLEILKKDIAMNKRYEQGRDKIATPFHCISWHSDAGITKQQMQGWRDYGDFKEVDFPGDHYAFLNAPEKLMEYIGNAMSIH